MEKKLPYLRTVTPNQLRIRETGVTQWLKEQEEQWKCAQCGEPLSWYRTTCTKYA